MPSNGFCANSWCLMSSHSERSIVIDPSNFWLSSVQPITCPWLSMTGFFSAVAFQLLLEKVFRRVGIPASMILMKACWYSWPLIDGIGVKAPRLVAGNNDYVAESVLLKYMLFCTDETNPSETST